MNVKYSGLVTIKLLGQKEQKNTNNSLTIPTRQIYRDDLLF